MQARRELEVAYRPFMVRDIDAMVDLWNIAAGEIVPMSRRLLEQNLVGGIPADPAGILVARADGVTVGWILARVVMAGPESLAPLRGRGGIGGLVVHPAWRGHGIGGELFRRARVFLAGHGVRKIETSIHPCHLVPGVPAECQDLVAFLTKRGFRAGENTVDLVADLDTVACPLSSADYAASNSPGRRLDPGIRIRPAASSDEPALLEFLAREFPGRWHFGVEHFLASGGDPSDLLLAEERQADGLHHLLGFCQTYTPRSVLLAGSTHWFPELGSCYGGLGPIGLGEAHRSRGLGRALLDAGIEHNRARGVKRMAIDWTDLAPFYEKAGFRVWKRWWHASAPLTEVTVSRSSARTSTAIIA